MENPPKNQPISCTSPQTPLSFGFVSKVEDCVWPIAHSPWKHGSTLKVQTKEALDKNWFHWTGFIWANQYIWNIWIIYQYQYIHIIFRHHGNRFEKRTTHSNIRFMAMMISGPVGLDGDFGIRLRIIRSSRKPRGDALPELQPTQDGQLSLRFCCNPKPYSKTSSIGDTVTLR